METNKTSSVVSDEFDGIVEESAEVEYNQISNYMYKMASKIIGKPYTIVEDTKSEIEYLTGLLKSVTEDKERAELQLQIAQLNEDLTVYKDAIKSDALNKVYNANVGLLSLCRKTFVYDRKGLQSRILEEKVEDAIQDGLIYAIKNFDVEKGYKFSTYAISIIKNFVRTATEKYYTKDKNDPLVSPDLKYFEDSICKNKDGEDVSFGTILPDEDEEIYRLKQMYGEDYAGMLSRAMQYFSEKDEQIFLLNKIDGVSCRDIIKKFNLNVSHQAVHQRIKAMSRELTQTLTQAKTVGELVAKGESYSCIANKLNLKKEDVVLLHKKYKHIFLGYAYPVQRPKGKTTFKEVAPQEAGNLQNVLKADTENQSKEFAFNNSIYDVKDKSELNETQKILVYLLGKDYDFSKFKKSITADDVLSFFSEKEISILCHAINDSINKEFVESMGTTKEIIYARIRQARTSFQKLVNECEVAKTYSEEDVKNIINHARSYNEFINSNAKAKKFFAYTTLFRGIKRPDIDEKSKQIAEIRKEVNDAILGIRLVKMLTYTKVMPEKEKNMIIQMAKGLDTKKLLSFLPDAYADMMESEDSLVAKAKQLYNEGVKCSYGSLRNERARACRYLTNLLGTSNSVNSELKIVNSYEDVGAKLGLTDNRVKYYQSVYDYLYNGKRYLSNEEYKEKDFVDNIGAIKEASLKAYREEILEKFKKMNESPAKKIQFINRAFGVTAESSPGTFKILNKVDYEQLFDGLNKDLAFQFAMYLGENLETLASILNTTPEKFEQTAKEQSIVIAKKIMLCNNVVTKIVNGEKLDVLAQRAGISIREIQKYKTLAFQIFTGANNELIESRGLKQLENVKQSVAFTKEWEKKIKAIHLLNLTPAYYNGEIVRENASIDNFINYLENVEDYTALNKVILNTLKSIAGDKGVYTENKQEFRQNAMRVVSSSKIDEKVYYLGSKSKEEVTYLALQKKKVVAYTGFYELFLQDAKYQPSIKNTAEEKALKLIYLLYDRVDTNINFDLIRNLLDVEIADILKLLKSDKDRLMAQKYLNLQNIKSYAGDGSVHNFKTRTRKELRKKLEAIVEKIKSQNSNLTLKQVLELLNSFESVNER